MEDRLPISGDKTPDPPGATAMSSLAGSADGPNTSPPTASHQSWAAHSGQRIVSRARSVAQ